jgi:glutaminyl-tRNA synthetase
MHYINSNAIEGWANFSSAVSGIKNVPELRWASPLDLKNSVEKAFTTNFGPKGAARPKAKVLYTIVHPTHAKTR